MDSKCGGILSWAVCLAFAAIGLIGFSAPAFANGTTYFINNQTGSNCNDAGPHTQAQPWCSFAPINQVKLLSPGDQVLLARGGTWDEQLTLTGSGSATQPIVLGAYGTGANPRIVRNQAISDLCVLLTDASNWEISNLEVARASVGILLHYTQLFNNGIAISNIYAHDNKGIWSGFTTDHPVSHKVADPFAARLNINLSSGILFNISSTLTFSSSQYVLRGVSVANILGRNNVDSVSFDAETNTTDNQDGHNAFQDVTLNGLILASDNGHAGSAYQHAGLGCSDSLRLLGMMNVKLLNSVLYDEAACRTASGTAAVILGRVSDVTFVNNIFFGVPATNSPDETGIDFEWSETRVNLLANLFAANAGAGVEILNIHRGDHTDGIDFSGNTFTNNSRSLRPGAASIWEDNRGSGYASPSGRLENNFYSESNGKFFAGKSIASVTNLKNVTTAAGSDYAAQQFAQLLWRSGWRYMYVTSDSTWADMPMYSATDYDGAWEVSPAQYVSAFNLMPASGGGTRDFGGVARVWVAPRPGTISIRGHVLRSDGQAGSGVYAVINHVSGRNVTQIWPSTSGKQFVEGSDQAGYATDVDSISVSAGDAIRFEVTANGDDSNDTTSWTPSVAYISSTVLKRSVSDSTGDGRVSSPTGKLAMIGDSRN
jgi:hypothetical protein